jgi:hypothetical protein
MTPPLASLASVRWCDSNDLKAARLKIAQRAADLSFDRAPARSQYYVRDGLNG